MACHRTLRSLQPSCGINTLAKNFRHLIEPQGFTRRYLSHKELGAVTRGRRIVLDTERRALLPDCRPLVVIELFIAFSFGVKSSFTVESRFTVSRPAVEAPTSAAHASRRTRQEASAVGTTGIRSAVPTHPITRKSGAGRGPDARSAKLFRPTPWDWVVTPRAFPRTILKRSALPSLKESVS